MESKSYPGNKNNPVTMAGIPKGYWSVCNRITFVRFDLELPKYSTSFYKMKA